MEPRAVGRWVVMAVLLPAAILCPVGEFGCGNLSLCVAQNKICNKKEDCPNGEDEENCTLRIKDNIIPRWIVQPPHKWSVPFNASCVLTNYPAECKCNSGTWLYCKSLNLTYLPLDVSPQVTRLILNNNSLTTLRKQDLARYPNLDMLNLEGNLLELLVNDTFSSLSSLANLFIKGNRLSVIEVGAFNGLKNLSWLTLQDNRLTILDPAVFANLPALHKLDLRDNRFHLQSGFIFPPMPKLEWILLEGNAIERLEANTFWLLDRLDILNLANNRIWAVHEEAFAGLSNLTELHLSGNRLRHLTPSFLKGLHNLTNLKLDFNPLTTLPHGFFSPVQRLTSLNLEGIEIPNITISLFSDVPNLKFAHFKLFHYCSFVPHVRVCRPNTDGVSSTENLLGREIQRFSVWFVAVLTCLGNAGVLLGRTVARRDPKIQSLFIRNLAAADILMGVYLMVIGGHDIHYRDQFNAHAHTWMSSWRCAVAGVLAMTSSEASVLILMSYALERYSTIASFFPVQSKTDRKQRLVLLGLCGVWAFSLVLAIFPVIPWSKIMDDAFYGSNGLCFPLHIDNPFMVGWQYSLFVFVGVNGCGVLVICYTSITLCLSIHRTQSATTNPVSNTEYFFHFLFIVITDCLCWIPIILLKIAALSRAVISADLYAWVVVFILPINSALNPFIYTFTTRKFRSRVRKIFAKQTLIPAWLAPNAAIDSADAESTSASSKRSLPKTVYHKVPIIGASCFHFVGMPENENLPPPPPPLYVGSIESCI